MSDHFLSAALLALTVFAAHFAAARINKNRLTYRVDDGPSVSASGRTLSVAGLRPGRHMIVLEMP